MFGTYQRLNVHCNTSNLELIKQFNRKMLNKDYRLNQAYNIKSRRKQMYKELIGIHERAGNLFTAVLRGL